MIATIIIIVVVVVVVVVVVIIIISITISYLFMTFILFILNVNSLCLGDPYEKRSSETFFRLSLPSVN